MSSEGLEQIVFFAFMGLILLQLLIRWARKANTRARQALAPGGHEQPDEPEPEWPPPLTRAAPPVARPRPTSAPTRSTPRAQQAAPQPGPRFEAATGARALRHANRATLRRAFVLATVLGPPRALEDER